MSGDMTVTPEMLERKAFWSAHQSRQAAADYYWEKKKPGISADHEYRHGYFDALVDAGVLMWIPVSGEGLEREPGVLKP